MAYMDNGDGDHHDEHIDGDGYPQSDNGLYQVIYVLMLFFTMFYFHM